MTKIGIELGVICGNFAIIAASLPLKKLMSNDSASRRTYGGAVLDTAVRCGNGDGLRRQHGGRPKHGVPMHIRGDAIEARALDGIVVLRLTQIDSILDLVNTLLENG